LKFLITVGVPPLRPRFENTFYSPVLTQKCLQKDYSAALTCSLWGEAGGIVRSLSKGRGGYNKYFQSGIKRAEPFPEAIKLNK